MLYINTAGAGVHQVFNSDVLKDVESGGDCMFAGEKKKVFHLKWNCSDLHKIYISLLCPPCNTQPHNHQHTVFNHGHHLPTADHLPGKAGLH